MIWKIVEKYPQLEISEDGQVRNIKTGNILKQCVLKNGYSTISTRFNGRKGKATCFRVHRVLAETFIPNPDNKPQVNHIDGNKLNNNISNLEWVTSSENSQHSIKLGLSNFDSIRGEKNHKAKLTEELIQKIKSEVIPGDRDFGYRALAKKYKISKTAILYACSDNVSEEFKSWKHINK